MLSKRILLLFGFLHISGKALARDCYKCNDIVADIVNCAGNNETTFDVTECGENACAKVTVYQESESFTGWREIRDCSMSDDMISDVCVCANRTLEDRDSCMEVEMNPPIRSIGGVTISDLNACCCHYDMCNLAVVSQKSLLCLMIVIMLTVYKSVL